jgi:SAM-dependent methyltransferase
MLQTLLDGYRGTTLIYIAAKLGLPDLLADGPQSSDALARAIGAHPPSLHRIMRGLVALGVFSEGDDGRFGLTALGACLPRETPGSLHTAAIVWGEQFVGAWGGLLHSALTGETAFNHVFGRSIWEIWPQHPEFNQLLVQATTQVATAVLAVYDFSSFSSIADVGGGHGALLAAILKMHPAATGLLFDQPHVVAEARPYLEAAGVATRCRVVGGNFFEHLPEGADLYILKTVIHDWDDEESRAILRQCHRALQGPARLLLIERVMPARVEQAPEVILSDLHMLAMGGGRERTAAEYRALFAAAGLALTRVIPTSSPFSLIEGIRAEAKESSHEQSLA